MPITRTMTGLRRSPRLTSTRRKQQKNKSNTQKKASKAQGTKNKARKTHIVQRKASKTRNARRSSVQQRKLSKYTRKELSAFFHEEEGKGRKGPKHRTKCIHWKKTGLTPGSTLSVRARCRARSPLYLNHSRSKKCPGKWQYLSTDGKLKQCYKGNGPFVRRRVSSK